MKNYSQIYALFLTLVFCTSCMGQVKTEPPKENIKPENKEVITSYGPTTSVRGIKQDRKGNIWIASNEGIIRYDGKSFTNITSKVSSARFFSVLEDRKGNFWFGSIGSGVYYYDGKSFRNFTTKEGLAGNAVTCIYEDKTGNIWFGTGGGVSRYDGKSFRNFTTKDGLPGNDINSIIEDKTGRLWFSTWRDVSLYNGKTFTNFLHSDKSFKNVRTIIEDKKGNIWLGGSDGLWRYNGSTLTNFTQKFVGYIMEDKEGNIWTSSESASDQNWAFSYDKTWTSSQSANDRKWALSRYDEKSLSDKKPTVTEITNKPMIFGILEDNKGNIWFGTVDGVYRYDGKTITSFNSKEGQK